VPTTSGRSRGRQGARARKPGAAGEHLPKVVATLSTALVVVILVLVMTKAGRDIDAATQRFMLYYAGVFALIGLTASVGVGLLATDRIVMTPAHRVMAQAVHRAVSFAALAFLVIHIVTEILAQRAHVIDGFIPFLSPYRTFYIGLGTIASDLILLVTVTSIYRKRFTAHGKAWQWRAIHYTSYIAFVFGVMHGLLGGRAAKPYVDWTYGFAIALTALAIVVRFLAISLRPRQTASTPADADRASGGLGYSGTSPLRTAALSMAQAHLGDTIRVLPAPLGGHVSAPGMPGNQDWAALPPAPGWSSSSDPFPAIAASPVDAAKSSYGAYPDPGFTPLGAPVYGDGMTVGAASYPYTSANRPWPGMAGPGAAGRARRQPRYEPEYDGPPRFEGAPRKHVPQDDVSSYPYGPKSYRQQPGQPDRSTGPLPRAGTGPMPRLGTGQTPQLATAPAPRAGTGPMPRANTGPMPRANTGPMPRADSGPMPRAGTGPMPRVNSGPMPRADASSTPRAGTGPVPRSGTGPNPRASTRPGPRVGSGPISRTGPLAPHDSRTGPRTGAAPGAVTRPSSREDSTDPRYREVPRRPGGDQWR
jgi:hypothetical protein